MHLKKARKKHGFSTKPCLWSCCFGLKCALYPIFRIVKVTVEGFEKDYSRKLAKIVSKTALDSLSLLFGRRSLFLQQALQEERLSPIRSHRLIETNGYLWVPGSGLSERVSHIPKSKIEEAMKTIEQFIPSITSVLEGLLLPKQHKYPKLVNRWATALVSRQH